LKLLNVIQPTTGPATSLQVLGGLLDQSEDGGRGRGVPTRGKTVNFANCGANCHRAHCEACQPPPARVEVNIATSRPVEDLEPLRQARTLNPLATPFVGGRVVAETGKTLFLGGGLYHQPELIAPRTGDHLRCPLRQLPEARITAGLVLQSFSFSGPLTAGLDSKSLTSSLITESAQISAG
jgi:hypothetical protein